MNAFKGTPATLLGTVIAVAAIAAWWFAAPAAGSGWILFVAFFGSLGLLNTIEESKRSYPAAISALVIATASGFAWYTHQHFSDAWAVGLLAVLSGLHGFNNLASAVKSENKSGDSK